MSTATVEKHGPSVEQQHSPDALNVPGIESKRAGGSGIVETDEETGLVTAIVSVTGVKDEVDDIIMPGAYKATLQKRTPKGVWSHDWNLWTARTETVEEIMPGDPRLPSLTRAGKAWPREAGVLLVKARFNLETQQGREAFSNVKFFADECEWSIGYTVLPGKASKDAAGVRHIKSIELFEFSPVLFGAMPLAGTLAVKTREQAMESKTAAADVVLDEEEALDEEGLRALFEAAEPEIDWAAVDAATLSLEEKAAGGADRNRGNAEKLRRYWTTGAGGQQIRWGTEGDFMRCVGLVSKHMTPERAKGYCNLRHQDAVGAAPGQGHKTIAVGTHPLLAEWNPIADGSAALPPSTAPAGDALTPSEKGYPHLAGSEEERRAAIERAVTERLRAIARDSDEGKPKTDGDASDRCYVSIDGTFADRVIATFTDWSVEPSDRQTYEMTYVVGADLTVSLGEPVKRELVVTVDVAKVDETMRTDAGTQEYGEYAAVMGKAQEMLYAESKAGRVLSSSNESRLRAAVENLVAVLRAAGVVIGEADPATVDTSDPETTAPATTTTGGDVVEAKTIRLDPASVTAANLDIEAVLYEHRP